MPERKMLGIDVFQAAKERISYAFDNFERYCVSFSGGKDSTVMLHMVMDEAIKRNKKVGVLFIDLEGQYKLTINHTLRCFEMYKNNIEPYWVALPLNLRNAVSMYQPQWMCWDQSVKENWIRTPPPIAITDEKYFPFFRRRMEFEEFVPAFSTWYSQDKLLASFVGIRTRESLNRWRTIATGNKTPFKDKQYTTWCGGKVYNVYPIYDWKAKDVWIYHGKHKDKPYNLLYDRMFQAGLTLHQMRICQPYGDDQRKGLWLFHIIEPETWSKIVARVNGANQGALYAQDTGNILGVGRITKPNGYTWKQFARLLLDSMPEKTRTQYENKIAVFLKWYADRGCPDGIPDDGEMVKGSPNWKRICKALLRNDYWCKGLSFSQNKPGTYDKYLNLMKKRREQWKLI